MIPRTPLALILAAALALGACRNPDAARPAAAERPAAERSAAERSADARPDEAAAASADLDAAPLPPGVHRGACLAHSYEDDGVKGYGSAASLASKKELAALGVDSISLTPFGWQRSLTSTQVDFNPNVKAGESDDRIEAEVAQARQLGLKVIMKPHLWINYTDWQGHIKPEGGQAGWDSWFESYTRFIVHFAKISERLKLDALVVGLELASASHMRERWVAVVDEVRKHYSGPLIYAANWNETHLVAFWDKVDFIGVQFFAPLSDSLTPSLESLTAAAGKQLDEYGALSRKVDKPVILTEYGYKSIVATAISPSTWPEHLPPEARNYDEANQALAYRALLAAAGARPFIHGVYIWKWFTNVDTDEEGRIGFSPRNKRAAKVVKAAYAPASP